MSNADLAVISLGIAIVLVVLWKAFFSRPGHSERDEGWVSGEDLRLFDD